MEIKVESRRRSVVKAIMYRAMATVLLAIISWVFTGDPGQTTLVTVIFTITATAAYYLNERVWTRINWT